MWREGLQSPKCCSWKQIKCFLPLWRNRDYPQIRLGGRTRPALHPRRDLCDEIASSHIGDDSFESGARWDRSRKRSSSDFAQEIEIHWSDSKKALVSVRGSNSVLTLHLRNEDAMGVPRLLPGRAYMDASRLASSFSCSTVDDHPILTRRDHSNLTRPQGYLMAAGSVDKSLSGLSA